MFWRQEQLTQEELALLSSLYEAHHASVFRENISSQAVVASMTGSGDYIKSITSGLMTLGNLHGPIPQTMDLLNDQDPPNCARYLMLRSRLVPGWGSTFTKDGPDPIWGKVASLLPEAMAVRIDGVTRALQAKKLWPNPSAYTAACAIVLKVPKEISPYLLVNGRLSGWTELALLTYNSRKML